MVRTFAAKSSPRFLRLSIVHVLSLMAVQLDIPIESQRSYFIYPSEIGSFALGSPLSDGNLFSLCQEHGNPSGFLKFFVSHSPNGPARQQGSASVKLCIPVSEEYLLASKHTYPSPLQILRISSQWYLPTASSTSFNQHIFCILRSIIMHIIYHYPTPLSRVR